MLAELLENKIIIVREEGDNDNILAKTLCAIGNSIDFEIDYDYETPFGCYVTWGNDYAVYPFCAYFDCSEYEYVLTQTDIGELVTGTNGTTVVLEPIDHIF